MTARSKLHVDLAPLLPRLAAGPDATALLQGCTDAEAAIARLEDAGFLAEAVALAAYALPSREAVWWACMCARHTAGAADGAPAAEAAVCAAAEAWVRGQTDALRRDAMTLAEEAGFGSPEAWAAIGAFWSDASTAPPGEPAAPPSPHLPGVAVAGSAALSAVRGDVARRDARLRHFIASARDIATGGPGRLGPERD